MDFTQLLSEVNKHQSDIDPEFLRPVYSFAEKAHATGLSLFQHAYETAFILAELRFDQSTIAAALLMDLPEYTAISIEDIQEQFGDKIAGLVSGTAQLNRISGACLEDEKAENLRRMFLAAAADVRVVFIKLADQLHKMKTIASFPEEKKRAAAEETLKIFAPLANRLGIWRIKWQLEDLAFSCLEPSQYARLQALLQVDKTSREIFLHDVVAVIKEKLQEFTLTAEVYGRSKHIYSIYRKMKKTQRDFQEIYDIRGVRLIVEDIKDCYAVLDMIHKIWEPVKGEYDDYIATPKANLYRSLHTVVKGPRGKPFEVQIRSREMHDTAEFGIAAHWRYKENVKSSARKELRGEYLRGLLEWQHDLMFFEQGSIPGQESLPPVYVYVFTPEGDIIDLPEGATAIDFAYRIHTEVGHRCRGAKINGKLVPLNQILCNADQVEIITGRAKGPSRDWLNPQHNFIFTNKAAQCIRQWFRRQEREENVSRGRDILERSLKRAGIKSKSYEEISRFFDYEQADDLFEDIGRGNQSAKHITAVLSKEKAPVDPQIESISAPSEIASPRILVSGVQDLLTRVAQCCNPLPGDKIVGFITQGRGISIHRNDCPNIQRQLDWKRLMEVDWGQGNQFYSVPVQIICSSAGSLLKEVAAVVEDQNARISASNIFADKKDCTDVISATLDINSVTQLNKILNKVKGLPGVIEARRKF